MAIRNLRLEEDEILRKISKPVKEITPKIIELLDDMYETMKEYNGIGLAAPQIGVLKRVVVIEIEEVKIELINPVILEAKGSAIKEEGCLSVPGEKGLVDRPEFIKVKALNRDGEEKEYEAEGLLAVAFCHELDHLDGILYIDKAIEMIEDDDEDFEDDDDYFYDDEDDEMFEEE